MPMAATGPLIALEAGPDNLVECCEADGRTHSLAVATALTGYRRWGNRETRDLMP